ncbi:MAG: tRNA guanosine(34) transglycosylase Tgt [Oscillospiraceae bacterium]|nr:tRNA guanosine(34) transglycosylase Tgt [Oscillospiraceae bacterium]
MFNISAKDGKARRGAYTTRHGEIHTPVFMNVATQGAIKGALSSADLADVGCNVALSNTYHLSLRPGDELIRDRGGLHKFMAWDGPLLTDSGGYQIFSLAGMRKISEEGVKFASHIDGRAIFMTPEDCVRIQSNLGSDIAMALDECVAIPAPREYVEESCARTHRWLERCAAEIGKIRSGQETVNPGQELFGINQGAAYADIRIAHMKRVAELDLPGYAIGGLAVGETAQEMYDIIEAVEEHMPENKPRYLMGVGTPLNIIEAVARGIDFFDCVLPARNGRHGKIFTKDGSLNINNERHKTEDTPLDPGCACPVCARYSRAYIRHLFKAGEMLAMRLAVLHNLYYYNDLMAHIRDAIAQGSFGEFAAGCKKRWAQSESESEEQND